MFSLIVVVIAIGLVAALSAVVMYMGSGVLGEWGRRAEVAKLVVESNQVVGAAELYRVDRGVSAWSGGDLVEGGYLLEWKKGWGDGELGYGRGLVSSDAVCEGFNAAHGVGGIPSCSDSAYAKQVVCCRE